MQAVQRQGSPLSARQARLWSAYSGKQIAQTWCVLRVQGTWECAHFLEAVEQMIQRHEILRTLFDRLPGMDLPVQMIVEEPSWSYGEIDLQVLKAVEQQHCLKYCIARFGATTREDLRVGPLLVLRLFRLAATQHLLLVSLPALCADAVSLRLFLDELALVLNGNQDSLEEVLHYADVSAWQEEQLREDRVGADYWRQQTQVPRFIPFQEQLEIECEPTGITLEYVQVEVSERTVAQLVQQRQPSLESWLLACWEVLLWRVSETAHFMVGLVCDGRPYEELVQALGPYACVVPVEAHFNKEQPFAQVLVGVERKIQEVKQQQISFAWTGEDEPELPETSVLRFPVQFVYESWPETFAMRTMQFSRLESSSPLDPFILKLSVVQVGETLQLMIQYDRQWITPQQSRMLGACYGRMLEQTIEQPQRGSGQLELLTKSETAQIDAALHGKRRIWQAQGLHRLFEAQVQLHREQLAIISQQEQWTYGRLNARANQLARVLRRRGVGSGVVVAVRLGRGGVMLLGMLAILKAGGAYLPVDETSPAGRQRYQLEESRARLLLTQERQGEQISDWQGRTLFLESLAQEMEASSSQDLVEESQGDDLAAVIYTSGSTGAPKGVMVHQSSMVNYTLSLCERLSSKPGWQYATVSTLAADLGNTAIFCALASGGCVQVLAYEMVTSGEAMAKWAEQHPIDVLKIVPSHLSALLESERAKIFLPRQALVLGGEALSEQLIERVYQLGGECQIYNHYGPTETTVGVLVKAVDELIEKDSEWGQGTVALGQPIANTQIYVLDGQMQRVPIGGKGELYIGGAGVAWGYIGQGGQTAERFVPHPYGKGERLYRTGDVVRYEQVGVIRFVGRRDGQVKLRGYRIELGEIEAVVRTHEQVRESVVLMRGGGGREQRLVCYIVNGQRERIDLRALETYLRERVPEYMVPQEYMQLEAWPLTANGKIDRHQLPEQEEVVKREVAEARSPLEELIVQVWQELLGGAEIGIYDNFFALGGHSLLATRVMARIQAMLHVELPVRSIFEASTVAGLARRVEQALREENDRPELPLLVGERPEELPLSYAQQRLWFLDQLEPGSIAYLSSRSLHIEGGLESRSLERSLNALIERHESLRTTFVQRRGNPVQVIQPARRHILPIIDVRGLGQERKEEEVGRLVGQEGQRPSDLAQGPLLRSYLIWEASQEHRLLFTLHHIITDGWSNEVLVRELTTLYQAVVSGQPAGLPPLPIQYADYALWQREWLQGEILEAQLSYWKKQLADLSSLALPTDYPRLPEHSYHGAILSVELPEELFQRLTALSQQENVTLFMLLLAALQVLLMRYTGQSDISVGTPIANRIRAEIENVIGFFVNTVVLRMDLTGNPPFLMVLRQAREICLQAYLHQDVPFEKLIEEIQQERDLSRSPLFQVSFQVEYDSAPSQPIPGLKLESAGNDGASADDELRLQISKIQQKFICTAFYDTNLFKAETIHRFLEHFQILLQGIALTPELPIASLPLITEQERHRQLIIWNTTQQDYPHERSVHQLFEQQVQRTPEAIALVFMQQTLTYAELNQRANQLAYHLLQQGVGPEVLVGICMERSVELVVGLLGVLKAGGAYVPLDPSLPQERLEYMLNDARVALVLGQEHLALDGIKIIEVAATSQIHDDAFQGNPTHSSQPNQLVYMIYTSGSTGKPKGAMNTQSGLINRLIWMQHQYPLRESDRVLQKTPFSFDVSVWEFFWPLITGARLVLAQPGGHQDPTYLKELIRQEQITTLHFVPSMLQAFLFEPTYIQECSSLRQVMCSGEALSVELQARFFSLAAPSLALHNLYGPTEASIDVTFWECLPDEHKRSVPIGRPIANTQIYLLDHELQPTPIGVAGELYIGGDGLARGYFQRPELTAERFVPNPFSQDAGERLYRAGDLAFYRPDGAIEFLGRVDEQVKLRGYRIELGEIEAVLRDHPVVQETVVMLREDRLGDMRLVAYVVLDLLWSETSSLDVQAPLVAERLQHWQQLYDETYQQETPQEVQTFNIVGWNSSYTGQPLAAEEMQDWLEETLVLVRSYHPVRIWEIGCGTGLLLFPLASTCTHYYGTDFSEVVLQGLHQQLNKYKDKQGNALAVTLLQRQADDFSTLPDEAIDTVVLNSVVQYFPTLDYLLRVLDGAVRMTIPGGRIIVGDIRSLPLLDAFHAEVQLAHAPGVLTRQQLWKQVQRQRDQEEELVLDPALFWHWAQANGQVRRVEVRPKVGGYHNELSQFRYQVVLHVGEPVASGEFRSEPVQEINWEEAGLSRVKMGELILREQPLRLRLHGVPNARVEQATRALRWLKGEGRAETVGEWRAKELVLVGVEPEVLREDAEALGYRATISWGQHADNGSYSVLLQRKDVAWQEDREELVVRQEGEYKQIADRYHYGNHPLQRAMEQGLELQIRKYLRDRLPEYMLPSQMIMLPALPLSPNGKLDRKRLLQLEEVQEPEGQEGAGTPLEDVIAGLWCQVLGRSQVGRQEDFFLLGGHSLLVTQLVARIRATLKVEIPTRVVFEAPTVAGMVQWIMQSWRADQQLVLPPLLPMNTRQEIPLSYAQQRLWLLEQLHPMSTTYLGSEQLCFRGLLNSRVLERSIQEIVQRHESLRTIFVVRQGWPMQEVQHVSSLVLPIIDLQSLSEEVREKTLSVLACQEAQRPCDLSVGPLFRVYLLRWGGQEQRLLFTLHHIITDGWSEAVLVHELSVFYRAFLAGYPSPLAPLLIQYADYAQWQRQWLQGELLDRQLAYWQEHLRGVHLMELPTDAPRSALVGYDDMGARYRFAFTITRSTEVVSFSRQEGVTVFMTLLAAFQVLLYRISGQADIMVGTDVANRTQVELEGLIGFFINLLALRTKMQGAPSFREVLQQVRAMVLEAYMHQEVPFELVAEQVQRERNDQQNPLIQVLCVLQNTPRRAVDLPRVVLEPVEQEKVSARFDLALFLLEEGTGIKGSVVYRAGLFKEQTIAGWMSQYEVLLGNLMAQPDTVIDVLDVYSEQEKERQAQEKLARRQLKEKRIRMVKSKGLEIRQVNEEMKVDDNNKL